MKTSSRPNALLVTRKNQQNKFGTFTYITENSQDLTLTCQTQPVVDERLMSARAIINTPREDREGDIIVPQGVWLENYQKNPVVLWEHGLGEITRPIAKCQHPDGNLALDVKEEHISAVSYFTEKSLESLQIFHLIAEGLVRATSVRAVPIKSYTRQSSKEGIGIVLEEWELIEWSWGALGVNPDAIARTIDRGTIEGHPIMEPLRKSLQAVLPTAQLTIPGFELADDRQPHMNKSESVMPPDHSQKKSIPRNHSIDSLAENGKSMDSDSQSEALPVKQDRENVSGSESHKITIPLGAQVLKMIQSALFDLVEDVESSSTGLENEFVKTYLKTFLQKVEVELTSVEKMFQERYPHLKSINPADDTVCSLRFNDRRANRLSSPRHQSNNDSLLRNLEEMFAFNTINELINRAPRGMETVLKHLQETQPEASQYPETGASQMEQNVEELTQSIAGLKKKITELLPA